MSISRRNFFKVGGISAVTAIVLGKPVLGQSRKFSGSRPKDQLMSLLNEDFRLQIGSTFNLYAGGSLTQAVLTSVDTFTDKATRNRKNRRMSVSCFSLRFEVASDSRLEQATYDVRHDVLGNFPLFLVPGAAANGQHLLHAVLNRR